MTRRRRLLTGFTEFCQGDPKQGNSMRLAESGPVDLELKRDAMALYQVADDLYVNRRFRIDP